MAASTPSKAKAAFAGDPVAASGIVHGRDAVGKQVVKVAPAPSPEGAASFYRLRLHKPAAGGGGATPIRMQLTIAPPVAKQAAR
ncbi:MAG: hypothetical protein ABSD88_19515, partial [Candidatus Korobacteraceae bacterium]